MNFRLMALALSFSCVACQTTAPPAPSVPSAFSPPTATEVFNLRSKCAELAANILKQNVVGVALTQDQNSHYDPKTNRCYVEIDVNSADLTKFPPDYYSRSVFDGQTGELLASIAEKKGQQTAYVKDRSGTTPGTDSYSAAMEKIELLMADDRKQ